MLAFSHAPRRPGDDRYAVPGRLGGLPFEIADTTVRDRLRRHEKPAPSLVKPDPDVLIACLLAFRRLAPLVRVEVQRLIGRGPRISKP